ncbi:Zn-dependent protease with chaperone function [Krasilnikovia cinnamomea]|uniref:Zn-dependent protease with chaperone function n=1 Tax=Krasilnikovia cinnamomea TaxID=349313 RepID=A0A4Q7ZRQ8_9ACTN|nr:M48 family metalloprotease [Krasilnikovia cinnamomea]RZU53838.1 Zn-dependent protease with chaperone function [Krasilnikovia cinnamomea]
MPSTSMSSTAAVPRPPATVTGSPAVPAPRRLVSMYVLVAVALVLLGGGAAAAMRDAYSARHAAAAVRCLSEQGIDWTALRRLDSPWQRSPEIRERIRTCVAPNARDQSLFMLAGGIALPLAAALLMLGGAVLVRWRLARGAVPPAGTAAAGWATERFAAWCDLLGLTGRRRPRLVLSAPYASGRQAFTTGLPFGAPRVVLPLGHAYLEPARFDVLVLHELAHVRSRDVSWAAAVWWTGWLSVPVLLVALSPLARWPRQRGALLAEYLPSFAVAVALSVLVLGLRAALLRRREFAADRYAREVLGDPDALRGLLGSAPARPARRLAGWGLAGWGLAGWLRRLREVHPPPAVRAGADPAAPDRWEGGFAVSAASALLAMLTVQTAYTALAVPGLAWNARLPLNLATAAGSLLWAGVIVPAWWRRARQATAAGGAPTWSGPVAGVVVGTVAGFLIQIPGQSTRTSLGLWQAQFAGHLTLGAGTVAVVAAGVAVLTAGLAVTADRAGWAVAAVLTGAAAWTTAFTASIWVLVGYLQSGGPDRIRTMLVGAGLWEWGWAPPLVLLGCGLAALRRRAVPVPVAAWVIGVAAATGGVAAGLSWRLRIDSADSDDLLFVLLSQRSMICAWAGWVVLAVLLASRRGGPGTTAAMVSAIPGALAGGFVAAAVAGAVTFGVAAAGGRGLSVGVLLAAVRWPVWQLFVAAVLTLPVLLAGLRLLERYRRRARRPVTGRVAAPATGLLVGLFGLALVGGALPPLAVGPHDWSDYLASLDTAPGRDPAAGFAVPPAPSAPTGTGGGDPGRPLDAAAATAALGVADRLLPAGHRRVEMEPGGGGTVPDLRPRTCRAAFARHADAERARARTADVARKYTISVGPHPEVTVTLGITSYVTPVRDFRLDRELTERCAHLTIPSSVTDTGVMEGGYVSGPPPAVSYPAYRTDFTLTGRVRSLAGVSTVLSERVLVGHNAVYVDILLGSSGGPPSAEVLAYRDRLAEALLLAVIGDLRLDR